MTGDLLALPKLKTALPQEMGGGTASMWDGGDKVLALPYGRYFLYRGRLLTEEEHHFS